MKSVLNLLLGSFFGIGLILSDMINPETVKGFLGIYEDWNPALAFVMIGAISMMSISWYLTKLFRKPVFGDSFPKTTNTNITAPLILGATIFGIGWGLVGLCPGPLIVNLSFGYWQTTLFCFSMIVGIICSNLASSYIRFFSI